MAAEYESTKPFLTTKFCPRRMATFGDAIWCKARAITRAWTITICSMMRMLSTASADAFSLRLRHCEEEGPPAALFQTASRPHYRGRLRAAVGCTGSAPRRHPKPCPLRVKSGKARNEHDMSGLPPCVDGSELARTFFTFAALVGAPVCSAFRCGSHDRWP